MTTATTYPATAYPRRKPVVTALQKPETTSGITYAIEFDDAKYQQDANIHRQPAHNGLRILHHIKTYHPHHIKQRHPPKPATPLPLSPLSYPRPQPNSTTASTSNPAPPLQPRKKFPFLQERRTLEPARERPEDAGKESGRLRRKIPPGPLREDDEDEKVLMGRLGDASGDGVRWPGVRG
ncbi:MAG: hypothetical protein FRX48_08290 [Lasallia pustulata]|uniref:Uncharacterized protein n=1 Tax=Lasallia pustulata TaxID=136370 RepID=A0A5M8PF53_9LECA|nr:MAG: hypothetical protein FRX48_08290 [Lasallia pustulata]